MEAIWRILLYKLFLTRKDKNFSFITIESLRGKERLGLTLNYPLQNTIIKNAVSCFSEIEFIKTSRATLSIKPVTRNSEILGAVGDLENSDVY